MSEGCNKAFTKLVQCPVCRGLVHLKPCNNYCMNVMRGCLAHHSELNEVWNSYLDAMLKIAERLEGPFNIESVVDPINVKISEAIMNFQEKSSAVSDKVFQGCGQPTLTGSATMGGRGKRQASSTQKRERKQPDAGGSNAAPRTSNAGSGIEKLIQDVKEKLTGAKDFWNDLPRAVCAEVASPVTEVSNCWNGVGKHRYNQSVVEAGLVNQASNPEVIVDTRRPSGAINTQILHLKLITSKLKNAYGGHNVDWTDSIDRRDDDEDTDDDSSGSGDDIVDPSSSGSGTDVDDDSHGIYFSQPDHNHIAPSVTSKVYVTERTRGPVRPIVTPRSRYTSAATASSRHFPRDVLILVMIVYGLRL